METTEELDVRPLIPIMRHRKLLKLFKELPAGDSFVFINDHDPKPLYYEFRSIYGDVVGWDYLQGGPKDWKVKVTRIESSNGREFKGISTLMDLRKAKEKDWKYAVFHRYGMMLKGDTMEIISKDDPKEIHDIFKKKFTGKYQWDYKKKTAGKFVVHVTKESADDLDDTDVSVINKFDVRPYPPAERHEMVFNAYDDLNAGEAFIFINDHDPKPLYYQMEAESHDPFKWEYLETMPEKWVVKIMKTIE
ncbi:MAG TPA: DUF2249 domain-containing protein [Balneolales bacterium]|nr:DUF2249 domain-containing protein [Balneolales bacterium]